ncbi:glutathione S-transferase C-terminal domain-containing protein [Streptomyces sp. NPDC058289]|uniref:glutathione S-transferase C-terminal domain-containing protein n=1 Tax=Streptomyces sp. NPDC058289 TaxID=3346425 RepID=UPI0036F0D330
MRGPGPRRYPARPPAHRRHRCGTATGRLPASRTPLRCGGQPGGNGGVELTEARRPPRTQEVCVDPDGRDPVLGIERLEEAYLARDPGYDRGVTVPAIVDVRTGKVVTNDFAQITIDMSLEWSAHHREGAPALYPPALRPEIDAVNEAVYQDVNNGVYRAGFAGSQEAYASAYDALFARLGERLRTSRYLVGDTITEADVRLFTTLARFDAVYHGHFKCNRQKLSEMPVLWSYARDLFQTPGFGDTVDFDHIKRHYYLVHQDINPTGVVPAGPDLSGWNEAHDRPSLGGRPFGDGTPPGPIAPGEGVPPGSAVAGAGLC